MKKYLFLAGLLISLKTFSQPITTLFEQSGGVKSPDYFSIIDWWKKLDERSDKVKMLTMGPTDAGFPLNLIVVSNNGDFDFTHIRKSDRRIILVINGIHPGEPDGIDASMLYVRDIVANKIKLPENVVLALLPVYNIGGCLNRSKNYRIDQNGPEEKGFRGNSENLDLNRDFIKCDSKEARSFTQLFHLVDPDIVLDNHVSDGADYQHVMTLISTQHDKLGGPMGEFMHDELEPGLYSLMKTKGFDLVPYVNDFGETPEQGWPAFWDSPRYSSGYAALWQSFSFISETHMLKPYATRVKSTYALMDCFTEFASKNSARIKQLRQEARETEKTQARFPVSWTLDTTISDKIEFKGYSSGHKPSEVSGLPRLYYDRGMPFDKKVPLYNHYVPTVFVNKPVAYVIPQGWWKVVDLLKLNNVEVSTIKKDTSIEVEVYHIDDFKSASRPYEMHHPNNSVKTSTTTQVMKFRKGDFWVSLNQTANRFLIETLEPMGEDSYFTWNFFDAILGQKEGFSDYSFEDIAANYLKENPAARAGP